MKKKEVLLENGERVFLEIEENDISTVKKFIRVSGEIIIGLVKLPPGAPPALAFWVGGKFAGGVIIRPRPKPEGGGCGGGGCGGGRGACGSGYYGGRGGHC